MIPLCLLLVFVNYNFLAAQATTQCGVRQIKVRRLLTNGYDTQPGDYPWHSAVFHLKPKREYVCGGSLISPRAIVTSAHCVTVPNRNMVRNADELLVKLGLYTLFEDSESVQEHSIVRTIIHNAFTHEAFQNDIALLITQSQINFNNYVQPVCLPKKSLLRTTVPGVVLGWGYTEDMNVANVLRAASAPIVSHRECRESNTVAYGSLLDETMFCAGWRNGTNPCNGDSGGGLFMQTDSGRWILNGIVTVTAANRQNENACSTSDYTVFVDVAKYVKWIDQQLQIRRVPTTKRYVVHNNRPVTFFEAWRNCQHLGHGLATITSKADSDLIAAAINTSSSTTGPWWIGGTDLGYEGIFTWITTNQLVGYGTGYLNFSPHQPDNYDDNEHCLEIGRWGGVAWNDAVCDTKQKFICEYFA
ncbi:chymotrypsin-C-like isoform X2 [Anopheles aquasalis]|uniref:chymotrypsin-C-like isoform X2 n=1 Tax=Anopheles aquasalis TaxID=42839 RepID=UPI00215AFE04|nr:chymotrypsin-C-like isoform X2 [Anopheles aquasalis]